MRTRKCGPIGWLFVKGNKWLYGRDGASFESP